MSFRIADFGLPFGHEPFGHELRAEWLRAEWRKPERRGKAQTVPKAAIAMTKQ
jgi:hypothetical protein